MLSSPALDIFIKWTLINIIVILNNEVSQQHLNRCLSNDWREVFCAGLNNNKVDRRDPFLQKGLLLSFVFLKEKEQLDVSSSHTVLLKSSRSD